VEKKDSGKQIGKRGLFWAWWPVGNGGSNSFSFFGIFDPLLNRLIQWPYRECEGYQDDRIRGGVLKNTAVPAQELRQAGQRRSLPSSERLRVYVLKRFDAQARRQGRPSVMLTY
jgi:hypothetical protein